MDYARGIDVSHYHWVKDWGAVPDEYRFIGVKASEGNTNTDPRLEYHRDRLRALGGRFDLVIYYHIARPGSASAQADRFLRLLGQLQPNERVALDTERTSAVPITYVREWFSKMPTDRRNILYTSNGLWLGPFMNNPAFPEAKDVDAWLPRYGSAKEPVVPDPWHDIGRSWTIWQDDDEAPCPGISDGICDTDIFNGTVDQLRVYAALG
jgi:GH25 family lysozyme M1 (1,4-beta-N-acetylmuramidase)